MAAATHFSTSNLLEIDRTVQETSMANTASARKATRVIAKRTEINKSRRTRLRTTLGKVEEAIASGDRAKAQSPHSRTPNP